MKSGLDEIKEAYENRDIRKLKEFASPTCRDINDKKDFSSALMLSCNNFRHLTKIESIKADAVILNLEDGVAKEDKPFALVLCAIFLSIYKKCDKKLIVRVNALDNGGYEEIKYLNSFMPDAIRVPKIKDKSDVEAVCDILDKDIELHLSIETKEAWNNLASLKAQNRVTTFYLGILDLFADMKLSQKLIDIDNPSVIYILSHFLITCKSLEVKPVSFVYQEFKDIEGFKKWIELEKKMGYDAKGCISPYQSQLVNDMFKNDPAEILRAKKIVKLFENNIKNGVSGFADDEYGFIDEPIYKGALALLEKNA